MKKVLVVVLSVFCSLGSAKAESPKSFSLSLPPTFACLKEAEKVIGGKDWAGRPDQAEYLKAYKEGRDAKIPEIETRASNKAQVINDFLKKKRFQTEITDMGPNSLYVAAVLAISLTWSTPGKAGEMKAKDGQDYPAVNFKGFKQFEAEGKKAYLLETKQGDYVYIFIPQRRPTSDQDLWAVVAENENLPYQETTVAAGTELVVPMAEFDQESDVSFIKGLHIGQNIIAEAKQQNKLALDEKGVEFSSGTAMVMSRGMNLSPKIKIDEPFVLVIKRYGVKEPLLSAFLDTNCWRKPAKEEKNS